MSSKKDQNVYIASAIDADHEHRVGYAWVKTNGKGKQAGSSQPMRLSTQEASTSLADVYAASDALNHLSAGSTVKIYTDNEMLANTLNRPADNVTKKARSHKKHIRKAWTALQDAVDRHEYVSAEVTNAEDPPKEMATAKDIAQAGATQAFAKGGTEKRRMEPNPGDKHKNLSFINEEIAYMEDDQGLNL